VSSEIYKKSIEDNLSGRDLERNISLFKSSSKYTINFIKLSSEEGVIRNGGRRGTSFAPLSILNVFKKFAAVNQMHSFAEIELANPTEEKTDFNQAQKQLSQKILSTLKSTPAQSHLVLGGGHDHIYPFLMAVQEAHPNQKIKVINIDPHMDMRIDDFKNSGTPFRQFDQAAKANHQLYSNVQSSLVSPKNIQQKVITMREVTGQTENYTQNMSFLQKYFPESERDEWVYAFSLDVDAINSACMEAVSAVNPEGINENFVRDLVTYFRKNLRTTYFGFFEYNPLYDNLSQKGARYLASLIERIL
jgi:formiminoglutamase